MGWIDSIGKESIITIVITIIAIQKIYVISKQSQPTYKDNVLMQIKYSKTCQNNWVRRNLGGLLIEPPIPFQTSGHPISS